MAMRLVTHRFASSGFSAERAGVIEDQDQDEFRHRAHQRGVADQNSPGERAAVSLPSAPIDADQQAEHIGQDGDTRRGSGRAQSQFVAIAGGAEAEDFRKAGFVRHQGSGRHRGPADLRCGPQLPTTSRADSILPTSSGYFCGDFVELAAPWRVPRWRHSAFPSAPCLPCGSRRPRPRPGFPRRPPPGP